MSPTAKKSTTQAGFSAEEKAAMRARAKELKAAEDGETAVQAALAEMSPQDRKLGKRLHALIKESAPGLSPKTWYGMPAYAKDGKRESRPGRDVADRVCPEELDCRRRGEAPRPCQEGREMRPASVT